MKWKKIIVVCFLSGALPAGNIFAQDKLYRNEFPLRDVTLPDIAFKHSRDLNIRTLGPEWSSRKLDLYLDDEKLATEDNTGRWNQSKYFDVEYVIPASMPENKNHVRIKFQSIQNRTAVACIMYGW